EDMLLLHEIINHSSLVLSKFHTLSHSLHDSYLSIYNSLSPGLAVIDTHLHVTLLNSHFKNLLDNSLSLQNLEELAGQFQQSHLVLLKVKEALQNRKESEIPDL